MADEVDEANELVEVRTSEEVERVRARLREVPVGKPGECTMCGVNSPRLVNKACAPCRDEYNLP